MEQPENNSFFIVYALSVYVGLLCIVNMYVVCVLCVE